MLDKLRQFFASGQPVQDDVAALKAEAAKIAAGWKTPTAPAVPAAGSIPGIVSINLPTGMTLQQAIQPLRPGSVTTVTIGGGGGGSAGYSNGYAQSVINQAQAQLNNHYNAQLQSALNSSPGGHVYLTTSGATFSTTGLIPMGSDQYVDTSPKFDPSWLVTYYEHRENAQVARIVEET